MGAPDPRAPSQGVPKTCDLYRLLPTPGYQEEQEICKYLAGIFEADAHECFKTHNEVTGALVRLRGRNRFVEDLSAWSLDAISLYDS